MEWEGRQWVTCLILGSRVAILDRREAAAWWFCPSPSNRRMSWIHHTCSTDLGQSSDSCIGSISWNLENYRFSGNAEQTTCCHSHALRMWQWIRPNLTISNSAMGFELNILDFYLNPANKSQHAKLAATIKLGRVKFRHKFFETLYD